MRVGSQQTSERLKSGCLEESHPCKRAGIASHRKKIRNLAHLLHGTDGIVLPERVRKHTSVGGSLERAAKRQALGGGREVLMFSPVGLLATDLW